MTIRIPLQTGYSTLIDEQDLPLIFAHRWRAVPVDKSRHYVARHPKKNGRRTTQYLHRLILQAEPGQYVDHVDGDPFNNQRSNLRLVTNAQNQQNRQRARRDSRSGIRNVLVWGQRYRVEIAVNGKKQHVGVYDNIEDAERAAIDARRTHMTHSPECKP